MKSRFLPLFVASCLLHTAHSATITWVGTTTGDWTTPTNWSNAAAPVAGNTYVATGSGKTVSSPTTGNVTFTGDSLLIQSGAKLRLSTTTQAATNTFTIPNLTLDGATLSPASPTSPFASASQVLANQVKLANAVTVEMNDSGSYTNQLTFTNGYTGSGSLALKRSGTTGSGRTITISGLTSGYSGAVTTSGTDSSKYLAVNVTTTSGWGGGDLAIGQWSTVTLSANTSGTGNVTVGANGTFVIGGSAGAFYRPITNDGTVNFSRTSAFNFSEAISGSGGVTQASSSTTTLGGDNTYTGNTSITAGILSLGHANALGSGGTITVSGGTLQFTGANNTDYSSRISIPIGAIGTFDTGLRSVTFANAFGTGTAAVTKTGIGTLTLSGDSTYTGATTVNAGRLNLVGSLSSPITVASGATLGGVGYTFGTITLASGSNLLISNLGLVQAMGVTATNANLIPDATSVVTGSNVLDVIGYGTGGNTPLTTDFNVTGFRSPTLIDDSGSAKITLSFTTGARTWAGTTGTWDLGTSTAWAEGDQKFFSGDAVTFPDIAADNVVTLTGVLAPSSIAVTNNAAFNHTFSGTGSIVGTTALTKSGAGTLTISTANTYSGGTTFNGGTLTASSTNALGIGPVTITSGTLALNAGALGNAISGTGDITVLGTANSTLSGDLTGLTGNINISATGTGKLGVSTGGIIPSTVTVNVGASSTLYTTGASTIAGTVNLIGTGNTENFGALRVDEGSHVTGSVVLGANASIGSSTGTGIISGIISETGGARTLTKQGGGTVILSGTNNYSGTTFLAGGTLQIGSTGALGSSQLLTFSDAASTLDIGSVGLTIPSITLASNTTSRTYTIRGGGTLTVNGASDLAFQNPGALNSIVTVDMSALGHLVVNKSANSLIIGGIGNNRPANVSFADQTTVTASNFYIQNDSSGNSTAFTSTVNLGTDTTLNVDTVNLLNGASSRDNATLQFRAGVNNATLKIRAKDGVGRAAWKIGASNTVTYSAAQTGKVDLTTGVTTSTLDALLSTLSIGDGRNNANGSTYSFTMGLGTLDATTLIVGNKNGVAGTHTSNFSVTGGTVKATTITLGTVASGGTAPIANFNLNGGATVAAQTIASGTGTATRTFNWNDGTISNLNGTTNLTVSIPTLKLAATGTHELRVDDTTVSPAAPATATVSAAIVDATTGGTLTKSGNGLATLSGANTYTGDTLVTGGTLSLTTAYLADGADVRLTNGAILNLTHGATDAIDEFYIDGVRQSSGTWGSMSSTATNRTARITGSGILSVTTGSAYDTWTTSKGLTGNDALASADPDNDGRNNLGEFAFDGTPTSGANDGKIVERIVPGGLTLTIPVRVSAGTFTADANGLFASRDGVTYRIQGSTDLTNWTMAVTEITVTPNTPTLSTGWEYRTFQVTTTGNQKAFIRAKVNDVVAP